MAASHLRSFVEIPEFQLSVLSEIPRFFAINVRFCHIATSMNDHFSNKVK